MPKKLSVLVIIVVTFALYIFYSYYKIMSVTHGEKIADYPNPKKALLIIDLQRDITEKNGKAILNLEQTDHIIANINRILAKYRNNNISVIYITQEFGNNVIFKLITNNALQHGKPGAEIDPRIKIVSNNFFIKHVADSFSNNDLSNFLVKNKINHLYITGVDAEYCVDKTIKGAINRNYKITVVKDAIGSKTDKKRNEKILEFKDLGLEIISTDQMLKNL